KSCRFSESESEIEINATVSGAGAATTTTAEAAKTTGQTKRLPKVRRKQITFRPPEVNVIEKVLETDRSRQAVFRWAGRTGTTSHHHHAPATAAARAAARTARTFPVAAAAAHVAANHRTASATRAFGRVARLRGVSGLLTAAGLAR